MFRFIFVFLFSDIGGLFKSLSFNSIAHEKVLVSFYRIKSRFRVAV